MQPFLRRLEKNSFLLVNFSFEQAKPTEELSKAFWLKI